MVGSPYSPARVGTKFSPEEIEFRERLRGWLRYLKDVRGFTNQELADELGLSEPHVTNILNGSRTGGLDVFLKLVRRGGIRPDEIVGRSAPEPPPDRLGDGHASPSRAPSSAQPRGRKAGGR